MHEPELNRDRCNKFHQGCAQLCQEGFQYSQELLPVLPVFKEYALLQAKHHGLVLIQDVPGL